MFQNGFLGTNASFSADLALIAELLFFFILCLGVIAQRRGQYKLHDWLQTPVVILNFFLILFLMVPSFFGQRVASTLPQRPADPYYLIVAIHAGFALIAQGLAIYCLLAGHKILPRRIGRLRYWMWATFGFWAVAVAFGVATYYVWYMVQPEPTPAVAIDETASSENGAVTPADRRLTNFMQNFAFNPDTLSVIAGTEVTWINQDGAPHNIAFVDGSIASDNFFRDESFSITLEEPGIYPFYCTLHGSPDGSGMAGVITVLAENEENVAEVAAAPTPDPLPPTPTPAPTVPPPPVELLAAPAPEQIVVGLVAFFDQLAPSDSLSLFLSGVSAAEANMELHAWLTHSQGGLPLPLGRVEPDANGRVSLQFNDPEQRNLLDLYNGFQLTQEPQFDDDPTPGPALYSGQQPAQAFAAIHTITVVAADTPGNQAYGLGARRQTEELLRHVENVVTAHQFLSIADAQRHAEHIVNLLEGAQGVSFGDLDGLHGVQNPGDGYGIIPYVTQMNAMAAQASEAPDTTQAIQIHAGHVEMAAANALAWADEVRTAALQILAARSVGEIGPQVEILSRYGTLLLYGEDNNNDGEVGPAEGGIFTAYQHAQYMAAIPVIGER